MIGLDLDLAFLLRDCPDFLANCSDCRYFSVATSLLLFKVLKLYCEWVSFEFLFVELLSDTMNSVFSFNTSSFFYNLAYWTCSANRFYLFLAYELLVSRWYLLLLVLESLMILSSFY